VYSQEDDDDDNDDSVGDRPACWATFTQVLSTEIQGEKDEWKEVPV
jgi:hypothetical protein